MYFFVKNHKKNNANKFCPRKNSKAPFKLFCREVKQGKATHNTLVGPFLGPCVCGSFSTPDYPFFSVKIFTL